MNQQKTTHFGYQQVNLEEKNHLVRNVFSSVSTRYNLMNDIMSLGIHRLWKRCAVYLCSIKKHYHVLDLAGGTGDIAGLIYQRLGPNGHIVLCDINADMLREGRNHFLDKGVLKNVDYVQADAEELPFLDNHFDCVTIAFGLRNVTNKDKALQSIYSKLKYGAQLVILEFSKVVVPFVDKLYQQYSFYLIPRLGKIFTSDEASYQYLVESIRLHPDQKTLADMMIQAGFKRVQYHNLSSGIVAIHRGYKL